MGFDHRKPCVVERIRFVVGAVVGDPANDVLRIDRCRDSVAWIGFRTTYKNAGTAKLRVSRTKLHELWVGWWVGKFAAEAAALLF